MVRRTTARGKFGREDKSAQMYSAFGWRSALLAMMSCARVCPSKSVGCSFETILVIRLRTRRCDCSFVLAGPTNDFLGSPNTHRATHSSNKPSRPRSHGMDSWKKQGQDARKSEDAKLVNLRRLVNIAAS